MMDINDAFAPLQDEAAGPQTGDSWRVLSPVPQDAPGLTSSTINRFAPAGYTFAMGWRYLDAAGRLLGCTVRYDRPANGSPAEKQIKPFAFCEGPGGRREWRCKALPEPRPLYRMDHLAGQPDALVLVVEGEKTADAAAMRFPDYVVVTSAGGSKAAKRADWTPLAGRHVVIWPDADDPGARYAEDVADMVRGAEAASLRRVAVRAEFPEAWDLADQLPEGISDADLGRMLAEAPSVTFDRSSCGSEDDASWAAPDLSLLGTGRRPAPEFPLSLLGPFWSKWAQQRARGCSAPVDYVAVSLLACAGAALANVRWPVAGAGWCEPPVLWCALVGSPSAGKSPSMDAAFEILRHAEDQMASNFDAELRAYETVKHTAEAQREAWKAAVKAAVKAGENPPPMPSAADDPQKPERPRIRVADVTSEKVGALAAALPRGLLMVRDEMAGWLGAFDKYGGGGSDRAFWIEAYGGRSYTIDRVRTPEAVRVRHLSIGVLGGSQPEKLPMIIDGPDDGLASRFLWSWPESLAGFSLTRAVLDNLDARNAFGRLAGLAMGSDEWGCPEPTRLRLTHDAENTIEAFARDMSQRAHEASGMFAGTLGKARGHVLRLSCVLEHLWWSATPTSPEPDRITDKATLAASGLVDGYFVPMAERSYGDASIPLSERRAMTLARYLRQTGLTEFNARDVRREIGGLLRDAAAMDAACAGLVEGGLLRPRSARAGSTRGRPARNFEVNPVVHGRRS